MDNTLGAVLLADGRTVTHEMINDAIKRLGFAETEAYLLVIVRGVLTGIAMGKVNIEADDLWPPAG